MERNDLAPYASKMQATMFEGVLASAPEGVAAIKAKFYLKTEKWEAYLKMWKPNVLPIKYLGDAINRLGIGTEVYTLLNAGIGGAIENWLSRKGIATNVVAYDNIEDLAFDLQFNRGITKIYTADQEQAQIIGFRSTVVTPNTAWSI